MKRFLVFASFALLPLALMSSAGADTERSFFGLRSFIGLWEGIDPVDGGDSLRSITCQRDQSCELAATDSVITLCGGGPGFASGTGGLEGDELLFPDTVLACPDGTEVQLSIVRTRPAQQDARRDDGGRRHRHHAAEHHLPQDQQVA